MVHGLIYSIQYEIHLTQRLDLFDQVLPLCIKTRKMIEYQEKNGIYKLVILNYNDLLKRFEVNPLAKKYIEEMYGSEYNNLNTKNSELPKSNNVLVYSMHIKNNTVNPMSDDEFNQLVEKIKELDESGQWSEDFNKMYKFKQIQEIVRDQTFNMIVEMEKELTKIELTPEEINIVNTIKSDEIIAPLIKSASINLCCIHY